MKLLLAQIQLFSDLCKVSHQMANSVCTSQCCLLHCLQGVHREAIEHITSESYKWLPVNEIVKCLTDHQVPTIVRSAYLDFATAAIVEPQLEDSGVSSEYAWKVFVSLPCIILLQALMI